MVALLSVVVLVLLSTVHCQTGGNSTPPAASVYKNIPLKDEYPAPRSGAAVGIFEGTSEYGFVILGGDLAYGGDTRGYSYVVDKNVTTWKQLKTKFSVSDACSAQDSANLDFLYIYGGTEAGTNLDLYQYQISKDTLTKIDFEDKVLRPPTQGATCGIRNGTLYIVTGNCGTEIFTYDTAAKVAKWVNATIEGGPTGGRKGASGLLFGDQFVLWGGNCGESQDTDVWRYDLVGKKWSSEKFTSEKGPDARAHHAAAVDSIAKDSFIIFGGQVVADKKTMNDTWVYSLTDKNWTSVTPSVLTNSTSKFVPPRQNTNIAYTYGRMFVFSGLVSSNATANDFWELVITSDCYQLTNSCGACVITDGCGWCAGNLAGYQCVPGRDNVPYIAETCAPSKDDDDRPYINDLCPPEGFPGWIIALIIVITILAIGVVWYFVIRCQKKSSGYDQIN